MCQLLLNKKGRRFNYSIYSNKEGFKLAAVCSVDDNTLDIRDNCNLRCGYMKYDRRIWNG
jgi:hypothetical protein